MSNFKTFGQVSDGYQGTAVSLFTASTADIYSTVTASGYMNDLAENKIVKANDQVFLNYNDTTVLPGSLTASYDEFTVVQSGNNFTLLPTSLVNQVGIVDYSDLIVSASNLAVGAHKILLPSSGLISYLIVGMTAGPGVNFSGGGGDRNISITDGTSVYSVMPAASLQALVNSGWGSTLLPYPASVSLAEPTDSGQPLYAVYSGGTTDYTTGIVGINIVYKRIL